MNKRKETVYKGWKITPLPSYENKGKGYRVWGLGIYSSLAAAKRGINETGEKGVARKPRKGKK